MSVGRGDEDGVSRRRFLRTSALLGGATLAAPATAAASLRRPTRVDVRDFGAAGNGRTTDTCAIQRAVDAVAEAGGGTVEVPPGTWLSGTIELRSRVTLELSPGAVLLASRERRDFAPHEWLPFDTSSDAETIDFTHALLAGRDLEHVAVVGRGVIDMNRRRRYGPKPIALKRCRFVTVRDVTIRHAPNYCVSLGGCDDVLVEGVVIRDAYSDGIDPDCCRRVRIANCDVESDDDALCLKASFCLGERAATEDVVVTNCRLRSPSNCFKLGTESTGDFRRVTLSNCVMSGRPPEDRDASAAAEGGGIAILTVDGGAIEGVAVSNVVMTDVPAPLFVRLGNRGRDQEGATPGRLRNVSISDVVALGATGTGSIAGIPGHPVEHVTLENVRITVAGGAVARDLDVPEREDHYPKVTMWGLLPAFGLYLRHARDVILRNVVLGVEGDDRRPALVADDVAGLHLASLTARAGNEAGPVVWLNDVRGAALQGSVAPHGVGVFVRVTGAGTRGVALVGNTYWTAGPVELAPELAPEAVLHAPAEGRVPATALGSAPRPGRS